MSMTVVVRGRNERGTGQMSTFDDWGNPANQERFTMDATQTGTMTGDDYPSSRDTAGPMEADNGHGKGWYHQMKSRPQPNPTMAESSSFHENQTTGIDDNAPSQQKRLSKRRKRNNAILAIIGIMLMILPVLIIMHQINTGSIDPNVFETSPCFM